MLKFQSLRPTLYQPLNKVNNRIYLNTNLEPTFHQPQILPYTRLHPEADSTNPRDLAHNHRLLSANYGLLYAIVAYCFRLRWGHAYLDPKRM